MTKVIFDPDAMAEFLEAVKYYEDNKKGLGVRYRQVIETGVHKITKLPFLYRFIHPPFRRYLLQKFPYAIIYSIEPDHIRIIAIAHTKRKPDYWLKRNIK